MAPGTLAGSSAGVETDTAGDPLLLDVVVAGINRNEIGLLIFPRLDACRTLAGAAPTLPTLIEPAFDTNADAPSPLKASLPLMKMASPSWMC